VCDSNVVAVSLFVVFGFVFVCLCNKSNRIE
jgi:hypothetical protein